MHRLFRSVSISLATQALSSSVNLLLGVYLVRTVSLEQFGLYNIAFAAAVFLAGIGNAMVITQLIVALPRKVPDERAAYTRRMTFYGIAVSVAIITLGLTVECIQALNGRDGANYSGLAWSTALLSAGFILRDLVLRYCHAANRGVFALASGVIAAGILGLMFWIGTIDGRVVSVDRTLVFYALSLVATAAVAIAVLGIQPSVDSWLQLRADIRESWLHSRWALVAHCASVFRTHSYTIVVAAIAGPAAVGTLNAVRLFFAPALIALPAFSQVLLPRLSELAVSDAASLKHYAARDSLRMMSLTVMYCVCTLLAYDVARGVLIGDAELDDTLLRYLWAVYVVVLSVRAVFELSAHAARNFHGAMSAGIQSAAVTIAMAAVFAKLAGADGALVALVLGEVVMVLLLWRKV